MEPGDRADYVNLKLQLKSVRSMTFMTGNAFTSVSHIAQSIPLPLYYTNTQF